MNIADKILRAKADYDAVYEAGKASGGGSSVDPDKIIEKTVTGTMIAVDDVSEVNHECTITNLSDEDVTVNVFGRNIFNISSAGAYHNNASQPTVDMYVTETGMRLEPIKDLTSNSSVWGFRIGTPQELAGKTITVSGDVISTMTGSRLPIVTIHATDVEPTTVREKPRYSDGGYIGSSGQKIKLAEGTNLSGRASATYTVTGEESKPYIAILFYLTMGGSGGVGDWTEWSNIQVEIGDKATSYEPFHLEQHDVYAGQSITVDSICPGMTVYTGVGAELSLEYHKSWGMQTEYDRFWDAFQMYGGRTEYSGSFNQGWSTATFRPKYNLTAKAAYQMFTNFLYGLAPASLKQLLAEAGVTLTFPACNNFGSLFQYSKITEIGELDFHDATRKNCSTVFQNCSELKTIDKIILPNGQTTFSNWFSNCSALENVIFEGEIAVAISFAQSDKLTTASVQNIIDHLKDLTGATAQTLTLHATVGANVTEAQKAAITAKNWTLVY